MSRAFPIPVLLAAVLLACGGHEDDDKNNELMAPGQNCLACHGFSVAGTVYGSASADSGSGLSGVTVVITDANGVETPLTTNAAGNFFSGAPLALPLKKAAVVRNGTRTEMGGVPEGACNRCHTLPPTGGAAGRIHAP